MANEGMYLFDNAEKRLKLWEKATELENQFSLILLGVRGIMQNDASYNLEGMTKEEVHELYTYLSNDLASLNRQISNFEKMTKETVHYFTEVKNGLKAFSQPLRDEYLKIAGELITNNNNNNNNN